MRVTGGYVEIMVRAPMETVQTILRRAMLASGFRMKLSSPYGGTAEKQAAGKGTQSEAPKEPFTVDFEVLRLERITVVRMHRKAAARAPGTSGGPSDDKQFAQLIEVLAMWFNQHGCLQGVMGL